MKKTFVILLIMVIVTLASFIYRYGKTSIYEKYPLKEIEHTEVEAPLFLYIFFSQKNCQDCLKVIEFLNDLNPPFIVIGVVPGNELKDEPVLRGITGAAFPLISNSKYKKYIPPYSPSILGVSTRGRIYFVVPGVPGVNDFLKQFVNAFYKKTYPYLIEH